ncbi:MAG: hypothetical protein DRP87_11250 [Spirochaetes bacterium]|nr:MAG: hypothetical protein DRP87_11250 [Spirochaetota bacterium]
MRKAILFSILFFLVVLPGFTQQSAKITDITGKVELKSAGADWLPARVGMEVSVGTIVSTGFNSSAVLDLGSSVINVKQLTRMTLEELIQKEGTINTSLFLRVGEVKANVKSVEGLTHDFTLKSSTSTASVRGTEFEYDGFVVKVVDGVVTLYDVSGVRELVLRGELSGGEEAKSAVFTVNSYTTEEGALSGEKAGATEEAGVKGDLVIYY